LAFVVIPMTPYGTAPFAISATSASSGAITYSLVSGPATLAGNVLTLTGLGKVNLLAVQVAAGNYAAATVATSFTVSTENPGLMLAVIPDHAFGDAPFTVSATSNSTAPITYSVTSGKATMSGSTVTITGIGVVTVSAKQVATGNFAAGVSTVSFNVAAVDPGLTFTAIPDKTVGTGPFRVTASSRSSGAITYSVYSGPATISGSAVTLTGPGTVVLTAVQAASGSYTTGNATTSFNVTP
jgi:hypothetical protein